ncbi:hypothetical protein FRC11_003951, partial [Ceratobasidium sp. 423]
MDQRLSVLREHVSRRRSLTPRRGDVLRDPSSGARGLKDLLQFVGGVYAWPSFEKSSDGNRRTTLEVVKLPSLNRGTDISRWTISDEKLDGNDICPAWIHPDRDLLVIYEEFIEHEREAPSAFDGYPHIDGGMEM